LGVCPTKPSLHAQHRPAPCNVCGRVLVELPQSRSRSDLLIASCIATNRGDIKKLPAAFPDTAWSIGLALERFGANLAFRVSHRTANEAIPLMWSSKRSDPGEFLPHAFVASQRGRWLLVSVLVSVRFGISRQRLAAEDEHHIASQWLWERLSAESGELRQREAKASNQIMSPLGLSSICCG
jgi:hypothetical protein